jgi:nucleotide-binding universal stress UspA family protein
MKKALQEVAVKLDRILIPLDGSPTAERALPPAMALLSERAAATVILMRAAHPTTAYPWNDPLEAQSAAVEAAQSYLRRVVDHLRDIEPACTVTTSVWYGRAARGILDVAQIRNASLIVMSTRGRAGLSRAVLGSVAESVLRATTIPVILVPPACGPALDVRQRAVPRVMSSAGGAR